MGYSIYEELALDVISKTFLAQLSLNGKHTVYKAGPWTNIKIKVLSNCCIFFLERLMLAAKLIVSV